MSNIDLGWRFAAIVCSLLIHLLIAVEWAHKPLIAANAPDDALTPLFVQLNFPQPKTESVMPVVEPQKVVEKEIPQEPKPQPKPKPKPKPKPQTKPIIKPVEELAETSEEPEVPQETVAALPPPAAASQRNADLRDAYLARLMAEIEKNKFYPSIARRRNLQGMVHVKFRLGCEGEVEELDISGEHNLLRKAASKAVEDSLPLPERPPEIECPLLINYAMAYTLEK
jgi:protein TonB